jgi:hypothetical protein
MMVINVLPKLKCQVVSWFVKIYFGWCEFFEHCGFKVNDF